MPVAVQRSNGELREHKCVDYPISFFLASSSLNSGSLNYPRIIAASSVHYGVGHPLNRTEILYPHSEGYMPEDASTAPRLSIITRRALLRSLLQALVSVKDIYRVGRASSCLHICTSSSYLDLVWNTWLPDWEINGWPTKQSEDDLLEEEVKPNDAAMIRSTSMSFKQGKQNSIHARRMSTTSNASIAESTMSAMTGDAHLIYDDHSNHLINEDLLRKVAIFRRNFFSNAQANNKGAAYIRLVHYRQNPADKIAKEAVKAASLDLTTQLPRRSRTSSNISNGSTVFSSSSSVRRKSQGSLLSTPTSPIGARNGKSNNNNNSINNNHNNNNNNHNNNSTSQSQLSKSASLPSVSAAAVSNPILVKRPAAKTRLLSKDVISEHGTETDVEDFNDARSTLSIEDTSNDQPAQGALAKVIALPTAVVAAGVAAVLAPSTDGAEAAETTTKEPAIAAHGSFAKETNEALDAVKVPDTVDGRGIGLFKRPSASSQVPPPSQRRSTVNRVKSTKSAKGTATKEPAVPAVPAIPAVPAVSAQIIRTQTKPSLQTPVEEPKDAAKPAAKQKSSFFSLRRRPKEAAEPVPATSSPPPSRPTTDRLIDYRPPQSRTLRSARTNADEKNVSSSSPSTFPDDIPSKSVAQRDSATSGRSRPFSFLRKRSSVREVF